MAVPVVIWSGCGDDDGGTSGCTPNATQQCLCSATVMGVQRCSDDGTSFEACDCSPVGSGGSGNGGSAGSSSAGASGSGNTMMQAPFTGATGLPCETDANCLGGMTCLPSSSAENPFGTGGIQRGICTSVCTIDQAGSEACQAVDSISECLGPPDRESGYCLPLCVVGGGDPQRCGGRVDMACIPSTGIDPSGQIGFCRPQCTSDVDCGGGRFCDLGTGFCVDALPERGPGVIGAACNAATELTDCITGLCFDLEDDGSGFCTAPCVLGSIAGCGFSQSASPRDAACFPLGQNPAIGDRGLCIELCDVEADCAQERYRCVEQSPDAQEGLGRFGQCVPPEEGADAGADGG